MSTQGIQTFSVLSNISMIKGGNSPGISSRKCRTRSAPEIENAKLCFTE